MPPPSESIGYNERMEQPIPQAASLMQGSSTGSFIRRFIEWGIFVLFILFSIAAIVQYRSYASVESTLRAAHAAFNSNDTRGAIELVDQVLARRPSHVEALLLKATALAQQGSLQFQEKEFGAQAIAVAQQVLAIDPDNVEAWRIIGYSNEIMQNYVDAHEAYAKALEIDPQNAQVISQNAHAYDLQGDAAHAELGYFQALQIDPTLTQAQLGYARSLLRDGRIDDALVLFRKVAREAANAHNRAEAAYSAGVILGAKNEHAQAEELMRQATQENPEYALGWVGLGAELFVKSVDTSLSLSTEERQALGAQSFAALQKALEINPAQTLARLQLGMQLGAMRRFDEAFRELELAKQLAVSDITLGTIEKAAMIQRVEGTMQFLKMQAK